MLTASLIALYRYGYLGVVFGWAIAAILLVGLVAWAYIARLIKDAIDEFLVFAIPIRWERDGCSR